MARKILLTVLVALFVLLTLASMLALAAVLTGWLKLATIPLMSLVGIAASDMVGTIWELDGQYDDGM